MQLKEWTQPAPMSVLNLQYININGIAIIYALGSLHESKLRTVNLLPTIFAVYASIQGTELDLVYYQY